MLKTVYQQESQTLKKNTKTTTRLRLVSLKATYKKGTITPQTIIKTLTYHALWSYNVRPGLDVLELDFNQRGPPQFIEGQLFESVDRAEEDRLWQGPGIQSVADQTPALQEDFILVLSKRPRTSHTRQPPSAQREGEGDQKKTIPIRQSVFKKTKKLFYL